MLTYIWNESWELRNAIRAALNGYDYVAIGKMFITDMKIVKYRITK